MHILPKSHINVLYFLNENEKRVVLCFEENENAVVFDIIRTESPNFANLVLRNDLKMAVPSNSALFEGIGGNFGYSLGAYL